jgi:hypothetical protein
MYDVVQPFPCRGRKWVKYEDQFLEDWIKEFGLHECARQLGRTPASVALRCAWLGIRKPKQAEVEASAPKAEPKLEAQTPEKAPVRPADAKEGVEAGKDKGEVKTSDSGASESENGISAEPERKVITIELPKAWTPDDDATLLKMRGEGKSYADCGTALGRTPHACESRLLRLKKAGPIAGLLPPSRSWSAEEDAVLRENWTKMIARDIVYLLPGRSLKAVYTRAQTLKLADAFGLHNRGPRPKTKPEQKLESEPKPKLESEPKPKTARPARKRPTESRPAPIGKMRRCHDCGKPTADFRCPECWAKLRANYEYEE